MIFLTGSVWVRMLRLQEAFYRVVNIYIRSCYYLCDTSCVLPEGVLLIEMQCQI